ncbi:hypothetical protein R5R35_010241 [Gryllus longicercus]|uniref:Secreted protein n=1 Tax=Gryllus longicercus TaxID=2509291 RepID=A0AAN9VL35_9ORTH
MLLHAKSLAPWLVGFAVLLVVGVLAAPPTHNKRSTWITRDGPPEPVSSNRRRSDKLVEPYESRCVHQGGICRYARDCPKGQLTSTKGLCPEQQKHGVECCYARPTSNNTKPRKSRNSQYRRHQRRYNSRTGRNEHPSERKMG